MLVSDHKRDFAREESEIAFIREIYNSVLGQSPYQVLGIDETATADEARKGYDERKRALASDRFLPRVRERMRSELTIIEARLTEVYLALEGEVAVRARESAPSSEFLDFDALSLRREVTKTEVAASIDEQERLGESYYVKARKYFSQGDYFNCIQFCTQALKQNDQEARYLLLMGDAQAHNPDRRWQKMAEQAYLQAIKLDPWNADYYVTLGQFYKRQGFSVRARRQFEKALQIQPGHQKAHEELVSIASSPASKP
jgi:tetratricopeptide (TPR) repeat protein